MSAINDLRSIGIWKFLKPQDPTAIPAEDAEGFEAYDKMDIFAMRYFQKALEEDLQPLLLWCMNAKAMWENIIFNFERKNSQQRLVSCYIQLITLIKTPNADIFYQINQLSLVFAELKTLQENVPVQMELAFLYASLPENFQPLVKVLIREENQTWQNAVGQINEEIDRMKPSAGTTQADVLIICHKCNRSGHIQQNCPNMKAPNQNYWGQ